MLVRESISFQRYKDPKVALFGLRPGQIVKEFWASHSSEEDVPATGYYLILELGTEPGKYISTELGYGMFNKINIWSEYERYGLKSKLVPASDEEIANIKQAYSENPEKLKSLKKYLNIWGFMDKKKELLHQLTESVAFQRYKDPKRALFGLVPGQLVKNTLNIKGDDGELESRTYVGIFLEGEENFISLGHFSNYDIPGIQRTMIMPGTTSPRNRDEKDLEILTPEEDIIVKKSLKSPRAKIILKNIEERYNVKPILESTFERYKDPKHALFGFRLGQLVVAKNSSSELGLGYDVDCIVQLLHEQGSNVTTDCVTASFGRFQRSDIKEELYFNRVTGQGDWFEALKDLRPLDKEESELMQKYLKDPQNESFIKLKEGQYMILTKGYYSDLIPENERIRIFV